VTGPPTVGRDVAGGVRFGERQGGLVRREPVHVAVQWGVGVRGQLNRDAGAEDCVDGAVPTFAWVTRR